MKLLIRIHYVARSSAICLSKFPNKFIEIFQNNLTKDDINVINKGRSKNNYTKIQNGLLSPIECKYITDNDKFQTIFALANYKIIKILIRDRDNDLADVKLFEDYLYLEIHVYNSESELIYKSPNPKKLKSTSYILNHIMMRLLI